MTLERGLKTLIEENVKDKVFKNKEGKEGSPKVIIGYLPPENLDTIVPCIAIRNVKGRNTLDEKKLFIKIIVGIYEKDTEKAYESIRNLLNEIVKPILEVGIIEGKYEVLPEYEYEIEEEQFYPYFVGSININILEAKDYRTDVDDFINGKWEA